MRRKSVVFRLPGFTPEDNARAISAVVALANLTSDDNYPDEVWKVTRKFDLDPLLVEAHTRTGRDLRNGLGVWWDRPRIQSELRRWLDQIIEDGHVNLTVRRALRERIDSAVRVSQAQIVFEDGLLHPRFEVEVTGVEALRAYAVALLVSRDADRLVRRLGRCVKCGHYFFSEREGVGRPRRFCSPEHANAHKQWVFNNRHKTWRTPALP